MGGIGEVNARVMITPVSLLISDERETETEGAMLANMAGNETPDIVSTAASSTLKVDITRFFLEATADEGRISPRTVQTTLAFSAEKK
jgi:hypothetical protein